LEQFPTLQSVKLTKKRNAMSVAAVNYAGQPEEVEEELEEDKGALEPADQFLMRAAKAMGRKPNADSAVDPK
jgi:hypothetical protein